VLSSPQIVGHSCYLARVRLPGQILFPESLSISSFDFKNPIQQHMNNDIGLKNMLFHPMWKSSKYTLSMLLQISDNVLYIYILQQIKHFYQPVRRKHSIRPFLLKKTSV